MSTEPIIYTPQPLIQAPAATIAAPTVQAAPLAVPHGVTVAYIPGPNGLQAAYIPTLQPAEPPRPTLSPLLVNATLGAGAFALTSLGLYLLGQFIEALAHLIQALVILAAIVCGAPVALQLLRALTGGGPVQQTVIHARRVRIGHITNRGQ